MTLLDQAHLAMALGDEAAARQFYRLLADAQLFVVLEHEAEGERITPKVYDLPDGPVLLAFDSEERLASLGQGPLPYAALPGRIMAQHLAGQGVSLGLNLGTGAGSETLLPPEALRWLAEMLDEAPVQTEARIASFHAPAKLPDTLTEALTFTLTGAQGLLQTALLAGVRYEDGRQGHVLVMVNAATAAQAPLARAVGEALRFSGLDAAELDVIFLNSGERGLAEAARVALVFDIPLPEPQAEPVAPSAPGMDPDRPPRLR
ncbi:MAG: SseB family protein [Cypionkella sp.]|nr:SseB family protein [Cypionkella sp.]